MTNVPFDRRKSDVRIDALENEIKEWINVVLDKHVDKWHPNMNAAQVEDLIASRQKRMNSQGQIIDRIVEMLEGKEIVDLNGNVVGHERGLKETAEQSYAILQTIEHRTNGGVVVTQRIRPVWTRNQKIAAWVGAGTVIVGAVSSTIAALSFILG